MFRFCLTGPLIAVLLLCFSPAQGEDVMPLRSSIEQAKKLLGKDHGALIKTLDSLQVLIPSDSFELQGRVFLYRAARYHYEGRHLEEKIAELDSAVFFFEKAQNFNSMLRCEINIAHAYMALEKHLEAITLLEKVMEIAKTKQEFDRYQSACNAIGNAYRQLSLFEEALRYNELAFEHVDTSKRTSLGILYFSRAQLYYEMEDPHNALKALAKADSIYPDDLQMSINRILLNLLKGTIKGEQERYEEAIAAFEQARAISIEVKNETYSDQIALNFASIYIHQDRFDDVLEILAELEPKILGKLNQSEVLYWTLLGQSRVGQGRFKEAEAAYLKALEVAEEMQLLKSIIEANQSLSLFYEQWGAFDKMAQYLQKAQSLQDSLIGLNRQDIVLGYTLKFKLNEIQQEKQALELAVQSEKNIALQASLSSKNWQLFGAISLVLLTLYFLLNMYRNGRRKIAFEHEKLALVLNTQEEERKRLALEIHDNVIQEVFGLRMLMGSVQGQMLSADYQYAEQQISVITDELKGITNDLFPHKLGREPLEQVVDEFLKRRGQEHPSIHFSCTVSEGPGVGSSLKLHLLRVIQELVQNSLKHLHGKLQSIQIESELTLKEITLEVAIEGNFEEIELNERQWASLNHRTSMLGGELSVVQKPNRIRVALHVLH